MPDEAPPNLPDLLSMVMDMMKSMNRMMDRFDKMYCLVEKLMEERATPTTHPPAAPSTVPPQSSSTPIPVYALQQAMEAMEKKREKAHRAVICRIPEKGTHVETTTQDERLITALIQHVDVPEVTAAWQNGECEHHRHPKHVEPREDGRPHRRPIKLSFPNPKIQSAFIHAHRKLGRPACLTDIAPNGFVRNDLTSAELEEERRLREEVRHLNTAAGRLLYGIRDAARIEYRNPRPLPPNYNRWQVDNESFSDGATSPLNVRR